MSLRSIRIGYWRTWGLRTRVTGTAAGSVATVSGAPEASLMFGGMVGGAVGGALYTAISEADANQPLNREAILHGAAEGGAVGLAAGAIATFGGEFLGPVTVGIFGTSVAAGILEPAAEIVIDHPLGVLADRLPPLGHKCPE